jgi:Domain of Unknown Function (DUF1080)
VRRFQTALLMAALGLAAAVGASAKQRERWISLFDGKDLSGWHLRDANAHNGWKAENGLLVNTPPSTDLVSDQKFRDFDIHYEYMYPAGSNSGVYLRGRYEIQIQDDYGKAPESHINGAIYGLITPSSNPTRPAGQWQTVDARIRGDQVTVVLNGTRIIRDAALTHPTGGALDDQVGEPGPIMLQGDHGPISFRNIRVRPMGG